MIPFALGWSRRVSYSSIVGKSFSEEEIRGSGEDFCCSHEGHGRGEAETFWYSLVEVLPDSRAARSFPALLATFR